ncbi:Mu transposase C-terminal domain-containing protein, partial [Acidiphilium sp.]|uniref:Mu transposase C-terminal domain-containing protein n=1 Tax=Acidiphilium sp. TaxID=527 RepID=UPI002C3BD31A
MSNRPLIDPLTDSLADLTEAERSDAMRRFEAIRPHVLHGVSLAEVARNGGLPLRSLQRWSARYRAAGISGLARCRRSDTGKRRLDSDLVAVIEGLALGKPRLSAAAIHRRISAMAAAQAWPVPSYAAVYEITRALDPALITLAHDGPTAYRDRFELIHRHRAERPNAIWQADHTQLDILVLDAGGTPARPWLTLVLDDHSRAIAGYCVFVGAPTALQTSLALRQAIWRKTDPAWPICGVPDILHVDHGSDFTSRHLEQVAADLRIELVFSGVARPQGRGKVERLFGTLNTELLPELPGHLVEGRPASVPVLSLSQLDAAVGAYIIHTYNLREHSEIGAAPRDAWIADGWMPRMPDSLEALDLLLVSVAASRRVRRDGIHFQGLRYIDPTLAVYVGEAVTIRYDP